MSRKSQALSVARQNGDGEPHGASNLDSSRLVEIEIDEANAYLTRFVDFQSRTTSYLGMSALMAMAAPLILGLLYWLNRREFVGAVFVFSVMVPGLATSGLWAKRQATKAFDAAMAVGMKLQRAEVLLRFQQTGFRWRFAAIRPYDVGNASPIDFFRLTRAELLRALNK